MNVIRFQTHFLGRYKCAGNRLGTRSDVNQGRYQGRRKDLARQRTGKHKMRSEEKKERTEKRYVLTDSKRSLKRTKREGDEEDRREMEERRRLLEVGRESFQLRGTSDDSRLAGGG